jgi:uncharacterized protein (TIRG00374 family)
LFKSRQFIIGIIISVIFFILAILGVRLDEAWAAALRANYLALIPALALYFLGVWVRAVRWRILLRPILPRTSLLKTFEVVVIGYMANDIFPARIGELVRAYVLSLREKVRKSATLATILVERIFDGITMVGFAAGAVLFIVLADPRALMTGEDHKLGSFLTDLQLPIIITGALFLGALVVFLAIASSRSRTERMIAFFLRFLPGRFRERVERIAHSFIDGLGSLRSASSLGAVLLLSIVAWSFETGMYYTIGNWGFDLRGVDGQPLPLYVYVMVTGFVNLGTLIPQAPGFLGVFEFIAQAVLHGAFGVNRDQSISYVLVLHVALLLPVTLLGFYYMARQSISYRQLVQLEQTRAQASEQAHEMEGPLTDIELVQEGKITQGDTSAEARLEEAGEGEK